MSTLMLQLKKRSVYECFRRHLSKATEDISDQTTNAEIATVKNSALEQLKAQRINPEVKKNALEAIRVVNKQIEIIKMQMHRRKKLHVRI